MRDNQAVGKELMTDKVITILALPLAVFLGGAWLMSEISKWDYVVDRLNESNLPDWEKAPLNKRLGYDAKAVANYWDQFDDTALISQQYSLEIDLVFPLLYSAAFATSLLLTWTMLGRPFNPLWIMAPTAVTVLADWTENLAQLHQLKQYRVHGAGALQANLIQIASFATCIKLIFFCALAVFLAGLVALVLFRSFRQG